MFLYIDQKMIQPLRFGFAIGAAFFLTVGDATAGKFSVSSILGTN
jgi:hypothetical protein